MDTKRTVVGSQTKFYPAGLVITVPDADSAAGAATSTNKPGITDPLWLSLGPIKWSKSPTHKTEDYMTPNPGAYVMEDEIVLSKGMTYKGKLEKKSNFATQLEEACQTLPTTGNIGVFNPISGSPVVKGWMHKQDYNQDNVLLKTTINWVSLRVSGDVNEDDKASETPVEAKLLYSPKNVGTGL